MNTPGLGELIWVQGPTALFTFLNVKNETRLDDTNRMIVRRTPGIVINYFYRHERLFARTLFPFGVYYYEY